MSMIFSARAKGLALALSLTTVAAAGLTQPQGGAVRVSNAHIPVPPNGAPTASAYATLTNVGRVPERFIGAASACCERVELHQMSMAGGVMTMRPLPGGVEIAPGARLSLSHDGYHLMLFHPRRPLTAGQHVPVTLRFQHAAPVTADFVVRAGWP
jgi:copper(I)-binding protein